MVVGQGARLHTLSEYLFCRSDYYRDVVDLKHKNLQIMVQAVAEACTCQVFGTGAFGRQWSDEPTHSGRARPCR